VPGSIFSWRAPILLALLAGFLPCHAQFVLDAWTVDGGGSSSGGIYSVSGTIRQPDMGVTMGGGRFALEGGFWGTLAAGQPSIRPQLTLMRSDAAVVVSWPLPADGWLLHATSDLLNGGCVWTEIPPPYQTSGANLQVTQPLSPGR